MTQQDPTGCWRSIAFVFAGSMIGAFIGFAIGFFGPLIFTPGASQGPLLSIFAAPAGGLLGALAGAIFAQFHGRPNGYK